MDRDEKPFDLAEAIGGPVTSKMADLAARYSISLICPFFEKGEDGAYYNSAALLDKSGTLQGVYRKVHVPSLRFWEERHYFSKGSSFPVFEVEGIKIGVQICWDNFFPEGFRTLALNGASMVFLPTAAAFASSERWLAMAVSHAVANGLYVVRVNRCGKEEGLDFYGQSFCVKPDGELATEPLGINEGMLLVDCDPAESELARRTWPFLSDRMPGLYGAVTDPALVWPSVSGDKGLSGEETDGG
jgi:N-carbamoylputrescine amidase